jgi:flavin reductase (DIM6/NTAB) family NADH-FMN oxidoreductase RutF
MPIDEAAFKLAMSHFARRTIVTTEHDGRQYSMTVAFASLSLRPPLCSSVSRKRENPRLSLLPEFGVSILGAGQADISSIFASRSDDKFSGCDRSWCARFR